MLATKWRTPFSDPEWSFELKFDGVRTLLYWDGSHVELRSRSDRDVTATYPELKTFQTERPCVIDGEIVAFDDDGRPSFQRLQSRMNLLRGDDRQVPSSFVAFDLLADGHDITSEPLQDRRARLASFGLSGLFAAAEVIEADGEALWSFVEARGIEGMVAKRLGSIYLPGARSADWRKVARVERIRAVVGGYTIGDGGRSRTFGSLLVGLWTDDGLRWCGAVGTGFSDSDLRRIRVALDEMTVELCPFIANPDIPLPSVWVEPQLVASIEIKEWTDVGRLRAPVFKGFTGDDPDVATWSAEGPESAKSSH